MSFITVSGFSQSVTETRRIKTTAIEVYEKYVSVIANLYNGNVYNEDKFMSLFDENALIYNDILPSNKPQKISPKEYFDVFTNNISMNYCTYDNLDLKFPTLNNDKWSIKCTFSKDIRFKTSKDYYYPKWRFEYIMTIEMDQTYNDQSKVYNNAKITNIDVEQPLEEFFIIQNKDSLPLEIYGDIIEDYEGDYNNRLLSKREIDINQITVSNNDMFRSLEYKQDQFNKHFYSFEMRKKNLIGFTVNYSPLNLGSNISKSNIENFNGIKQHSNTLSLSFLYGLQLGHVRNSTYFFNTRIEANWYNRIYKGNYYTEYQSIDTDGDPYLRKIKINSLRESGDILSASLPLSFQYITKLTSNKQNPLFLSFELGGFAEYRFFATNNFKLFVDYTGYYSQYFDGIEFTHYYDYGHFNLTNKDISVPLNNQFNKIDYGAFGSIGLWYALNKTQLLQFNISYKHGFTTLMKYKENYIISKDFNTYETLLQSTKQGSQNIYFGVSFISLINSKRR